MRKKIQTIWSGIHVDLAYPAILIVLVIFLATKNYTPQTFLTGWDTLHPEFNLSHAFSTVLHGVWRNDQGLGAIAGHSHMAELPRLFFLLISSYVVPLSFVRYSFFFTNLLVGPLGVFYLVKRLSPSKLTQVVNLSALLSAVFYLLNLTTLQHFYVPFEMFAVQYAALPWLFLCVYRFLSSGRRRDLAFFALVSFLAAPQAYAATLFYAWAFVLLSFLAAHLVHNKLSIASLKKVVVILTTLFATNAFWILPNMYSILFQSSEIRESSINQIFSNEAFLHNKAYGDIADVAIGKSFLFHWQEYDFNDKRFVDLLQEWNNYLQKPYVVAILYFFAAASVAGLVIGIVKRDRFVIYSLPGLALTLFFLINENSPTGGVFRFMREHSSLIEEGFRMPFTKFSLLFLLVNSVYVSHFFASILRLYKNNVIIKTTRVVLASVIIGLLVYMVYPMFTGSLISPSMRVTTPQEYFEAFNWFKGHEGRVAQVPLNSMWGWQYNSWGYQGAGFFWFGIDNPYLTRDFDRWSGANETFYLQASHTLASKDAQSFDLVLKKYNVRYLVLDESIINAGATPTEIDSTFLKETLDARYKKQASFSFLSIYQTPYGEKDVTAVSTYSETSSVETYNPIPSLFPTVSGSKPGVATPFANSDPRSGFRVSFNSGVEIVGQKVPKGDYNLTIPHFTEKESFVPVKVSYEKQTGAVAIRLDLVTPDIVIDGSVVAQDPVYMLYTLKTKGKTPGYLSINNQVFVLPKENKGIVGTVVVPRDGETTLALYGERGEADSAFGDGIGKKEASFCSVDSHKVITKKVSQGFEVTVADDSVCLGDGFVVPQDSLVSVSYTTHGPLSPFFCVNKAGVDGCVNRAFPVSLGKGFYQDQVVLDQGDYWFAFVAQSQPNAATVSYQDISIQMSDKLSSVPIEFGKALQEFVRSSVIPVRVDQTVSVKYSVPALISENWNLSRGHSQAYNCDLDKRGTVQKTTTSEGVTYEADGEGVSCDYFDYRSLAPNRSYLVRLTGVNELGRSMKLYVSNSQTNRVDKETLLGSGSFDSSFVIHPVGESTKGYVANVETRSFGRISSKNELQSLSWYYLPYNWLKGLTLTPLETTQKGGSVTITDQNTHSFISTVTVESPTGGIVSYNQAYDRGFVAMSNGKLLPSVVVNGWANGWEVQSGKNTIFIVFLPQLLEYVGIIFLFVTAGFILHKVL